MIFLLKMMETINIEFKELLEDHSNYRLSEITKCKSLTNKLSKYLTAFDYFNKILTVVLTVFSGTNIFSNVNNKQV